MAEEADAHSYFTFVRFADVFLHFKESYGLLVPDCFTIQGWRATEVICGAPDFGFTRSMVRIPLSLTLSLSDFVLNTGNIYFYFICRTQIEHYTTLTFGKASYFKTKLVGDVFLVCDISS